MTRPAAARADLLDAILFSPLPDGLRGVCREKLGILVVKHRVRTLAYRERLERAHQLAQLVRERVGLGDEAFAAAKELKAARRAAKQALCEWLAVEFAVAHMDMAEESGTADLLAFSRLPAQQSD